MTQALRILLISLSLYLVVCQTSPTTDGSDVPKECMLSDNAKARVDKSPCFSELQNIIACMPKDEQNLWAERNANNTDGDYCFKCKDIGVDAQKISKNKANQIAKIMTDKAQKRRNGMSCLKKFANENLTDQSAFSKSMNEVCNSQGKQGQCLSQLIQNVENLLISRKRFFCCKNSDRAALINLKESTKIKNFIYNSNEASNIVKSFLTFFQCINTEIMNMTTNLATLKDQLLQNPKCISSSGSRILQSGTSPSNSTQASQTSPSNSTQAPQSSESGKPPQSSESGKPPQSSESGKPPQKPSVNKNKQLKGDDFNYAINAIQALGPNKEDYTELVSKLKTSFDGSTEVNTKSNAISSFLANLNMSSNYQLNNLKGKCINENVTVLYIIQNSTLKCNSCIPAVSESLTFKDNTIVPSSYYMALGCDSKTDYRYFTFVDKTDSSKTYTTFEYNDNKKNINTDKKLYTISNACLRQSKCSDNVKSSCIDDLNKKCQDKKLMDAFPENPTSEVYPKECDSSAQGVSSDSDTFISTCLNFIEKSFFRGSMNWNPQALDSIGTDTNTSAMRVLQDSTVKIISTSQDTTSGDQTFATAKLNDGDVIVDGATSTNPGSTTDKINEITKYAAGEFLNVSVILILILALIL